MAAFFRELAAQRGRASALWFHGQSIANRAETSQGESTSGLARELKKPYPIRFLP